MPTARTELTCRLLEVQRQFGSVFSRDDLHRGGIDGNAVWKLEQRGIIEQVVPDVFAMAGAAADLSEAALHRGAVKAGGRISGIGGTTSLAWRGLWNRHDDSILVLSRHPQRHGPIGRFAWRRSSTLEEADIDLVRTVPTISAMRSIADAAAVLDHNQLCHVIWRSRYERQLDLDELEARCTRPHRIRGGAVLRRPITLYRAGSAGTRVRTEDRSIFVLKPLFAEFGEPIPCVRGITGDPDYEPDLVWTNLQCILEIDGDIHHEAAIAALDSIGDDLRRDDGWHVMRIPWIAPWQRPAAVRKAVAAFLGSAEQG